MAKNSDSGDAPDLSPDEKSVARSHSKETKSGSPSPSQSNEESGQKPDSNAEKGEAPADADASSKGSSRKHTLIEDEVGPGAGTDPNQEYSPEEKPYGYDLYYGSDAGRETDMANRNHEENESPAPDSGNQWSESPHPALAQKDDRGAQGPPGGQDPFLDDEEEGGGGPVKTFLEHLEDLRWVLIKSISAVIIGMVVCLVAGNRLIELLRVPLDRAEIVLSDGLPEAHVFFGTNLLTSVSVNTNQLQALGLDDGGDIYVNLELKALGTNLVFSGYAMPEESAPVVKRNQIPLKGYGPISPFMVALQIALYGGIGLASPFVIYFVGDFVLPALRRKEKAVLLKAVFFGAGLFAVGVVFCYTLLLHVALYASVNFAGWMNFTADEWRMEDYISFICKFMLAMGLSFELPVVILSLVRLDLITYQQLSKFRPYWIIANAALSSILTPPDPMTMILMALPLQVLYEVSVFIAWIWHRNDLKKQAAEAA